MDKFARAGKQLWNGAKYKGNQCNGIATTIEIHVSVATLKCVIYAPRIGRA